MCREEIWFLQKTFNEKTDACVRSKSDPDPVPVYAGFVPKLHLRNTERVRQDMMYRGTRLYGSAGAPKGKP